jgi:hypothetical protein
VQPGSSGCTRYGGAVVRGAGSTTTSGAWGAKEQIWVVATTHRLVRAMPRLLLLAAAVMLAATIVPPALGRSVAHAQRRELRALVDQIERDRSGILVEHLERYRGTLLAGDARIPAAAWS